MEITNWIDELKKQINKEEDESLFLEATGCLNAGFYRSAYIISWIAIVESLKNKIYRSSNLEDAQAQTAYSKIIDAECKKLSVDKIILEQAIELKLVDTQEESKLDFLWGQRCIFAHPYSIAPTAIDVKYIITALVGICLSKPLLYKKNYIDELINNLITKPFFIAENDEIVKNYARKIISRVPSSLHPHFFKVFLFNLGSIIGDDEKFNIQLKIRHFLVELFKLTPLDLSISEWPLEHRVINYPYECIIGFVHWDIWSRLPERIKDLILEYSITEEDENKQIKIRQVIGLLLKNIKLENKYKTKFLMKLDSLEFRRVCNYYGNSSLLYDRIIKEFDSNMYTKQNSVIDFLKDQEGCKFIAELNHERQIKLGWYIMISSLMGSWTAQNYLNDSVRIGNLAFGIKIGLLYGNIVTSENFIYIKKDNLIKIFKLIDKLQEEEIISAFDYVINKIKICGKFNAIEKKDIESVQTAKELKDVTNKKITELSQELNKHTI